MKNRNNLYPIICHKNIISFLFILTIISSCKKLVQISPPATQITAATTYSNNASAAAVMTGVFMQMSINSTMSDGNASIGMLQGLAADELKAYYLNDNLAQFYANGLSSSSNGASNVYYWKEIYSQLHTVNAVIDGLNSSSGVTPAMKQQLLGEAKFIRAFYHFYAVNLYGDIPLITTSNYLVNSQIPRTPKIQVYQQIIQDLKDAQSALSDGYLDASGAVTAFRIRPNKGVATALLARVYLYVGDLTKDASNFKAAEDQSSLLINNTTVNKLVLNLNNVFLGASASQSNTEAIWQLWPATPSYNTQDGTYYVLTGAPGTVQFPVAISDNLRNSFETGDKRFLSWIGAITTGGNTYYYAFKYKIGTVTSGVTPTEYPMVMRLAEQFLIRAEARAEQGEANAVDDLNSIRQRAGLSIYSGATDKVSLINAIMHERQVELFTEWGHRWFDLIRSGKVDAVMGSPGNVCATKGGVWSPNWAVLPIPLSEIQADKNLRQNTGY